MRNCSPAFFSLKVVILCLGRIIQKQKSYGQSFLNYPVNLLLDWDTREALNTKTSEILTLNVLVHTWQTPNKDKWLNCFGTRAMHDLLPRSEKASFPKFPVAPFPLNRAKPLKQDLQPKLQHLRPFLRRHICVTKGEQLCFPNDTDTINLNCEPNPKTDPEKDPDKSRSNLHSNELLSTGFSTHGCQWLYTLWN